MPNLEKLKIAQVTPVFPPYPGGIGNVAYHLANGLAKKDLNITVFTPLFIKSDKKDIDKYAFNIKMVNPLIKYGNAALLPFLIKDLLKFDLIHLHYPFFGGAESIYLLKRFFKKKTKLIVHYHMDVIGERVKKYFFKFHTKYFLGKIVKAADKVIVSSFDYALNSNLAEYMKLYNEKFIDIPHGVNIKYYKPGIKNPDLVERYSLENKKVIIFVGSLDSAHYFKGVNYLIKAVEMLTRNDYKVFIIGEGNLRSVYEELVDNKDLNKKIVFTGYLQDLRPFYHLADIFVLPSVDKSESFGLVLAEAMACQLPVVVSDLVGVRKLVDNNVNGILVKPKDASSLAKALDQLLNNENLRVNMGKMGLQKVINKYSWEMIIKKIIQVYEDLS